MNLVNVSFYDLKEIAKTKKIVCFGAGRNLSNFLNNYDSTNFIDDIFGILDNNDKKSGTFLEIRDKQIPISSVDEFVKTGEKNAFLVISCLEAYDIYEQLNEMEYFQSIEGSILNFIRAATNEQDEKKRYYPTDFKISSTQKIPKVIHYCWFGGKEIPKKNKEWMETWKKYCPDYEIVEWNENNYDYKKNEYMYEAYKARKWGFVPDYARLDIIYNHGGIYLDTDVELVRNFDELLYQEAFAGVEGTKNINFGLGFGAAKDNKIIRELMQVYSNMNFDKDNMIASPTLERQFFQQKGYINNGDYQIIEGMSIYPEKVLSGKCIFCGEVITTDKTFSIHHYDASWVDKQTQLRREKSKEAIRNILFG